MSIRLVLFIAVLALLWAMAPQRRRGRGRRRKPSSELSQKPSSEETGWAAYKSPNEIEEAIKNAEQQKRREVRRRIERRRREVRRILRRRPRLIHSRRGRRRRWGLASVIRFGFVLVVTILFIGVAAGLSGVQPLSIYTDRYLPFIKAQEPAPHPAVAVAVATDTPAPTATVTSVPTTPAPRSTPTDSVVLPVAPVPTSTTTLVPATATPLPSKPTPVPSPPMRHIEAKTYMLELINKERVRRGIEPVELGDNWAAQLHAESALANCFLSHWGMDGLKPYMRYSAAGGYQSNGENGHGIGYCPKPSSRYRSEGLEASVKGAVDGWMSSRGHRDNMLYRHHRKANIGIAWDGRNFQSYLHLEGDHTEYDTLPQISPQGVLTMSGSTKNGADFRDEDAFGVYLYYDPPPQSLTLGQLARTYCYGVGRNVAALRPPPSGGAYYSTETASLDFHDCPNPQDVDPDAPIPNSFEEAMQFKGKAHRASESIGRVTITFPWITADEWRVTANSFAVTADLSDVLRANGDGIYTVTVWGLIDSKQADISKYSIWVGIAPPDTYRQTD